MEEVAVVWSRLGMEKDKIPRIAVTWAQEENRMRGRPREAWGDNQTVGVGSKILGPGLHCCAR